MLMFQIGQTYLFVHCMDKKNIFSETTGWNVHLYLRWSLIIYGNNYLHSLSKAQSKNVGKRNNLHVCRHKKTKGPKQDTRNVYTYSNCLDLYYFIYTP